MSAALKHDPQAALDAAWAAEGAALFDRIRAEDRRRRGVKAGGICWDTVNALALDPEEAWRFGPIIGAREVAGVHKAGALEWWPGDREEVVEFALADRAVFVGRYTGRCWDTRTRAWARDPVSQVVALLGIRPGQAAWRIAQGFGLTEAPHVR